MWNIAKRQGYHREYEPKPPCPLPKMVIDQCGENTEYQADTDPNRLTFDEEINVSMAVTGECACAEKHHDADDQQSEHREKKNVGALTMHISFARMKTADV